MNPELIERAIEDGHAIAAKLKKADTVAETNALNEEIESYADFVDNYFGVLNDFDEKTCELSKMLYMAVDEKIRYLEYYHDTPTKNGNEDLTLFEDYLDSKTWIKSAE